MKENEPIWEHAREFVKQAGLDQDEYFNLYLPADEPIWLPANGKRPMWVEVAPVEGSNEGYYVHVRQVFPAKGGKLAETRIAMLGKYWSWDRAFTACRILTLWIADSEWGIVTEKKEAELVRSITNEV